MANVSTASVAPPALCLEEVSFTYRGSDAGVHQVSLEVPAGSVFGLIGQNGAGKTTLMRLMTGLLKPKSGRVLITGEPFGTGEARRSVGSLIETPSLYLHLSGLEHLHVFTAYYELPDEEAEAALELVGLADAGRTLVRNYSLGMKQRLAIATALLHDPELLVLDEPGNGLDPVGIAELRALLARLAAAGKAVIVSSHLLAEVEKSAARIAILHRGRLRFEGTPAELSSRVSSDRGAGEAASLEQDYLRFITEGEDAGGARG